MKRAAFLIPAIALAGGPAYADDTPMLHPVESVCIEYQMSGQMMNGTSTRCHRDYGYEQYEIQNTSVGVGGFSQTTNQHTITIGETIYAINLDTNTATKTTNPIYQNIVAALQDTPPEDMAEAFLAAMGFTATAQTKTIAGEQCTVYNSSTMGTACLTDNGLMLETSMMGMGQIATNVNVGAGGDDANYTLYQNVPITDGPDLSGGLDGLIQQMQQQ